MKLCQCGCHQPLRTLSGRGLFNVECYQAQQRVRDRERYCPDISAAEIEARYQAARAAITHARRLIR